MTFRLSCLFSIHQTRKSSGLKFGKTEYLSMGIRFQIKRSGLRFRPTRLFNQTKMHSFRHCPKPFADKFSFSTFFLFTLLQIYKSKYLVSDTHICPVMIIEVEVSVNDILGDWISSKILYRQTRSLLTILIISRFVIHFSKYSIITDRRISFNLCL